MPNIACPTETSGPLAMAPATLRKNIARLCTLVRGAVPSPLPIATALTLWTESHGLHLDDAAAVLAAMCDPSAVSKFKFESDVMADLAARCDRARRDRRDADRREADRRARDCPPISEAEQAIVRKFLDEYRQRLGTNR